jgi:hypothetical protein
LFRRGEDFSNLSFFLAMDVKSFQVKQAVVVTREIVSMMININKSPRGSTGTTTTLNEAIKQIYFRKQKAEEAFRILCVGGTLLLQLIFIT